MDELVARLRARIVDPSRRVDRRTNAFSQQVRTMSLGQLLGSGRSIAADLQRVVAINQAGAPMPLDIIGKVDQLEAAMQTSPTGTLRPPADADDIAAAEAVLGFPLRAEMRTLWTRVADGGFGPGPGLLPLADAVRRYRDLTSEPQGEGGQRWPAALVPIVAYDGDGFDCLDQDDGRIIGFDPQDLGRGRSDKAWQRGFREVAPSLAAFLTEWLDRPDPETALRERMEASMREHARASRDAIRKMSPEERAAMGLPESGWEHVVWGGLGLDED
jgi:SMI1/KNR4 family protein SUKH-1